MVWRLIARVVKHPLVRTVGQLSGARLLNVAASFVGAALVSRELGPTDRGIYSLVTVLSTLAVLIFTVGLPTAMTWQVARGNSPLHLLRTSLGLTAFAVAGALVCLTGLKLLVGGSTYARVPTLITCLLVGALTVGMLVRSLVTGLRQYALLSRLLSTYAVVTAGATAVTAIITGALQPTLYAALLSTSVVYASYLPRVRKIWQSLPPQGAASSRESGRFAGIAWVTNIVQQFNFSFGLLALAAFASPREVGLYAAAVAIAQVLWLIPSAASEVAFAEAASTSARNSLASFKELTGGYLWGIAALSAAAALLMWPLSYVIIPLVLGAEFRAAITPLLLLLPGVACFSVAHIGGNTIAGMGRIRLNLVASTISAVATVLGGFVLIPLWGAAGAAITSTGSYLVATVLTLAFLRRISRELTLS